ncbi:NAD(P)H-dependent FMN reductase LOT6 [Aspergillus bombycis]|uniref:NAD(P)H-dependent FMN reductase LOT6 n=1 Tax=Aspergillus bombycis TaxID=109264 RepID=A0A1F8A7M3_9EURO|nr:NAD(P)H-dependent FMN reductase LOT6 [Aspergillus bombycis]OGM47683.1 NAD(P)H-dependent FMN reductase LOT6 [Aspergillus bombycis]
MAKVALIKGSTRTPSVGPDITDWVHNILKSQTTDTLQIELLDIADFNLPVYDEPVVPAMVPALKQFTKEHSKKWSAAIASFQGYIFVIPEYNLGLAGGTKNAIDYLYSEWPGKPVAIISYGAQGGKNASQQLSESLRVVMKMEVMATRVLLPFAPGSDVYSAINEGALGEESRKAWEDDGKKEQVLQAWKELKDTLEKPKEE